MSDLSIFFPRIRLSGCFFLGLLSAGCVSAGPGDKPLERLVAAAPAASFKPSGYTDDELYLNLPYYLKHFARVANAVVLEGTERGFINLHVWRSNFEPYNFRALETHNAFAYFYTKESDWNPYYGDPAVRARLEAILERLAAASERGDYYEWPSKNIGAATLSFGSAKLMLTLEWLESGPPINPAVLADAKAAAKRMILELFKPYMFRRGGHVSNQLEPVWFAAIRYLNLYGDPEIEAALREAIPGGTAFQSPAGFFYESGSTEWGYNLGTHRGVLNYVATVLDGWPELKAQIEEKERRFWEWVSYSVSETAPDSGVFALNGGIQSRHLNKNHLTDQGYIHAARDLWTARAFSETRESYQQTVAERRAALAAEGPAAIEPLPVGSGGAYRFPALELVMDRQFPSAAVRVAARAKLPYHANGPFLHQRVDLDRFDPHYAATFLRQPGYYAVLNTGSLNKPWQRLGLGLLWHPAIGTVLQNRNAETKNEDQLAERPSWGVAREPFSEPMEGQSLDAEMLIDGQPLQLEAGTRDLPPGDLTLRYGLGADGRAEWRFEAEQIDADFTLEGDYFVQLPMLVGPGERVKRRAGEAELATPRGTMRVRWMPASEPEWQRGGPHPAGERVPGMLAIPGKGELKLRIDFTGPEL